MFSFVDLNRFPVTLTFQQNTMEVEPQHVLVLAKQNGRWLLTEHPKRGIEFPGGKVENNETLEQAAIREVLEETGATIEQVEWFAEYVVHEEVPFCKAVFLANIRSVADEMPLFETNGVVWLTEDEWQNCENLSFHMRDDGMKKILERVKLHEAKWND